MAHVSNWVRCWAAMVTAEIRRGQAVMPAGNPERLRTLTEVEQPIRNGRTMFIVISETAPCPERVAGVNAPWNRHGLEPRLAAREPNLKGVTQWLHVGNDSGRRWKSFSRASLLVSAIVVAIPICVSAAVAFALSHLLPRPHTVATRGPVVDRCPRHCGAGCRRRRSALSTALAARCALEHVDVVPRQGTVTSGRVEKDGVDTQSRSTGPVR